MSRRVVAIAIIVAGKVLLTKREDLAVWCLLGGETKSMESPAQTAIREVNEETGLLIESIRAVSIYSRPQW